MIYIASLGLKARLSTGQKRRDTKTVRPVISDQVFQGFDSSYRHFDATAYAKTILERLSKTHKN